VLPVLYDLVEGGRERRRERKAAKAAAAEAEADEREPVAPVVE